VTDVATDGRPSQVRYRCNACGNLTRFDVVSWRRTKAYHHYTVGGDLVVDEEDVLAHEVEEVTCRWCGHGRSVEVLVPDSPDSPSSPDAATQSVAATPAQSVTSDPRNA
jgi:hypothetical protein